MKIEVEIADKNIHNALERPHSCYWTNEAYWDPEACIGYVVDVVEYGEPVIKLDNDSMVKALAIMSKEFPNLFGRFIAGETDGVDGDSLLQLMAFGELKYG